MVSISTRLRNRSLSLSRTKRDFMFLRMGVSSSTPCRSRSATRSSRQIAFIPDQFAKQALGQVRNRTAIIHSGGSQTAGEDLALVVDHQMEFEAVEPIHRVLPALGQPGSVAMVLDAAVMTDDQLGRIDKGEAITSTAARLQIRRQRDQDR